APAGSDRCRPARCAAAPQCRRPDAETLGAEVSWSRSVRLDARELDNLAPLLGLGGEEFAELGGRHRHRVAAQILELALERGIGEARGDGGVELVDDR